MLLRTCLVPLLVLAGATRSLAAQDPSGDDGAAIGMRAPWDVAVTGCAGPRPRYFGSAETTRCKLVALRELGTDGDTAWYFARYRTLVRGEVEHKPDSVDFDELVLIARPLGTASAWLRWAWARERDVEFLDTLALSKTPSGTFVTVTTCLNGTGGCAMHYLVRERKRWAVVQQAFISSLADRLPADHRLHKGQRVDLARMEGVWPVAREGDSNCCPSFEVSFRLRRNGSRLELRDMSALRPVPRHQ